MYLGTLRLWVRLLSCISLCAAIVVASTISSSPAQAVAGINQQINYQGRLFNAAGATVPDGYYNIQFKIYQDGDGQSVGNTTGSPAGSLLWTESHLNVNTQGVQIKNGFMSVELGSVTPFGSSIDWNQDKLWVSLNIGSTNGTCASFAVCTPDGEMVPMKRLSAVPYSLNSRQLGGLSSSQFVQLAQGVQTDASSNTTSIYLNKTAGGNFFQLQSSGIDVFTVANAGDLTLGSNANKTITIATSAASTAGRSLTLGAGIGGSGTGSAGGDLVLQGGSAGGTNGNGGNVTLNAGAKTGTGTDGTISIGSSNTSSITLGQNTTLAAGKSLTVTGGATATRPASPTEGMIYYDTTTKKLLTYANGKWQADRSTATKIVGTSASGGTSSAVASVDYDGADYVNTSTTSAQTVINTALSSMPATGGSVYLMEGTYVVDGSINIPSNVTLTGAGAGTVIKLKNGINADVNAISNSDPTNGNSRITIANLSLDGNKANNTTGNQFGISLARVSPAATTTGAILTSLRVENFLTRGLNIVTSSSHVTVSSSVFQANAVGANVSNSNYVEFSNNSFISNTPGEGLWFNTSANYGTITGNIAYGNGIGIRINGTDNVITGNIVNSSTDRGIYSVGANNTITGNKLYSNGGTGANSSLDVSGSGSIVTSNNITDTAGTAFAITITGGTGVYLANNVYSGTGATSINDAGTNTVYGGQLNSSSALVLQASGGINLQSSTTVTGSLTATTSLLAPLLDTASAGILNIGTTNASSISLNKNTTIAGDLTFDATSNRTISIATSAASTVGRQMTLSAGTGGSGTGSAGGDLVLQGGSAGGTNGNGGNISLQTGAVTGSGTEGTISIGTARASTIQVGSTTLSSGTQAINIGNNNTAGGTTNVTIGNGSSATAGSTTVQAKDSVAISTNGITRATFNNANSVYFGNGVTAAAPNNFTVSGTGSSTTAVSGGAVTVQGGNATVGNANGGNLTLSGGTGVGTGTNGIVVITTPTFSTTANDPNCYTGGALVASSCTVAAASVNNSSAIIVGFNQTGQTATLPDPTIATAGRIVYLTAANASNEFTLSVNGGGSGNLIAMRQNTTATMIWNGNDWTAAGASSSTTLQAAYDNTLTSAGGAELVLSNGSNANGLTIRDSSTNPVNGTLLEVQNGSAANLFSVNSNVTEYTSNSGAETAGGSSTTFPASTWTALGSSTIARYITAGTYIATGQASASVVTTAAANDGIKNTLNTSLTANQHYNVSFSAKLASGTFTDMAVYYSVDGTANTVTCATGQAIKTKVWTKINCTFTAPSSGITASNSINIRQVAGSARTLYVDNISVTIAADYNYATDGTVNSAANFATNWVAVGTSTVSRITTDGQEASDSAQVIAGTTAGNGIKNKLSINPLASTLYRVSVYAKLSSGSAFSDFTVRYTPDNGTNFVDCVDYRTQTIVTTEWTQITCYIDTAGTAVTNPYVHFVQTAAPGVARTYLVDAFSMTLSSASTPNVQIGSGTNGGPVTLFTLDRAASAPIAANNDALLGSMYYDTTLGKLQCYEADGWGACGSSPDNIITISPEYTNAVLNGTGVGTLTSNICSDFLNIYDGTSGQATICGANETFNFYKWTSPQSTAQTYSIYVTYQLPSTFNTFTSGQTSLMGRTDSTNSTVNYQVYRNSTAGLTQCGGTVSVSTGAQTSWQIGRATGTADPTTCAFAGGDSIVFKINVTASQNANAYVGNLNFTFSNR